MHRISCAVLCKSSSTCRTESCWTVLEMHFFRLMLFLCYTAVVHMFIVLCFFSDENPQISQRSYLSRHGLCTLHFVSIRRPWTFYVKGDQRFGPFLSQPIYFGLDKRFWLWQSSNGTIHIFLEKSVPRRGNLAYTAIKLKQEVKLSLCLIKYDAMKTHSLLN